MTKYLETTVDKFIFRVVTDRYYNSEGVWAKEEDGRIRIGLSDFVQQRSGDVAFAEVKPVGTKLNFDDEVAVIETIKVDITFSSPVSGMVVEVNPAIPDLKLIDMPVSQDGKRAGQHLPPPTLGSDTDAILDELGYSEAEVADWREQGIIT